MNTFYDTKHLTLPEKTALMRDCKEISYYWLPNVLDCSVSHCRQYIDKSFDEMLELLAGGSHFVVIDRGGSIDPTFADKKYFEIGFCTSVFHSSVLMTYYLFIYVESHKMPSILEKYRLSA